MTPSTGRRWSIIGLAAAAIAMLAPGIAHAEPPSNDDFDTATAITALPFQTTVTMAEATSAPDDPFTCVGVVTDTVWFDYTAPADGFVQATMFTGNFGPIFEAYTGERGQLVPVSGFCEVTTGVAHTIRVTAGTTYHLMVALEFGGTGPVTVKLDSVPPAPNDDFAGAQEVSALPAHFSADLGRAGPEPNEPTPGCNGDSGQSVWYVYRPQTSRPVSAAGSVSVGFPPTVTVYRGTALAGLTELDCTQGFSAVFAATAGETYYLRVASGARDAGIVELTVALPPPLAPFLDVNPSPGSVLSDVQFFPFSGDPLGRNLISGLWRFGDGGSAPFSGQTVRHRYAVDGTYQVEFTGSTIDGRTGTATQTFTVATHDVSVTSFTVPARARAGQTKPISVLVANTRHDENVQVELFKKSGFSFVHIGTLTQFVPARANRTVEFPFAYTYSAEDAAAGGVTFKAVATLNDFRLFDANPADNEMQATTTVR